MNFLTPPRDLNFQERSGDPRLGEWVLPWKMFSPSPLLSFVILGYADDTGVRFNRGRPGAAEGPDSIRRHLFKMTLPMNSSWEKKIGLFDAGNLAPSTDIKKTHALAQEAIRTISAHGAIPIALGGGHDFAAPTFLGVAESLEPQKKARLGLVNVDPHLDVRELENGLPHSGTPFREILESGKLQGKDFVEFGIRQNRNAQKHFEYCLKKGVSVLTLDQIKKKNVLSSFKQQWQTLHKRCSHLALTIDMDSCADAEGTSAAPVLGFSATELIQIVALSAKSKKIQYLELAEVAPSLDPTQRSSRIAAEIIYQFLLSAAER